MPIRLKAKPKRKIKLKHKKKASVSRNKERREVYRTDKKFRKKLQTSARNSYRKKNEVDISSCLHSLEFVDKLAQEREVVHFSRLRDGVIKLPVLTLAQTALALQKMYQTIWRWTQRGQLPEPAMCISGGKEELVYHLEEVRIFIEEIGEHEKEVKYYRRDHTEVIDRIFGRVKAKRKELGL